MPSLNLPLLVQQHSKSCQLLYYTLLTTISQNMFSWLSIGPLVSVHFLHSIRINLPCPKLSQQSAWFIMKHASTVISISCVYLTMLKPWGLYWCCIRMLKHCICFELWKLFSWRICNTSSWSTSHNIHDWPWPACFFFLCFSLRSEKSTLRCPSTCCLK